ncbi:MAG: nickel pincer cofactor biosynthesis protein LarB [Oscillospiraceae bacterium]
MNKQQMLTLLQSVKDSEISPSQALEKLKTAPFDDLGFAKIDNHRAIRQGVPEVIFGQGKTPEQIDKIVENMLSNGAEDILITRMAAVAAELIASKYSLEYNELPKLGIVNPNHGKKLTGSVVVVSAGTSDMSVAEEAAITAEVLGSNVTRIYDAGVAGLHRLLAHLDELTRARVIVAVAGMEGALASVVGGLVEAPVVAVPTSVGYGANLGGLSALLSMLNSCSSGISVVNIDNGFGAGYIANIINKMESAQ